MAKSCAGSERGLPSSNGIPTSRRLACCSTRPGRPIASSPKEAIVPLALRELQAAFAAHVAGADRAELVDAVIGDAIPAAARLDIHRHHVFDSLRAALAAT